MRLFKNDKKKLSESCGCRIIGYCKNKGSEIQQQKQKWKDRLDLREELIKFGYCLNIESEREERVEDNFRFLV